MLPAEDPVAFLEELLSHPAIRHVVETYTEIRGDVPNERVGLSDWSLPFGGAFLYLTNVGNVFGMPGTEDAPSELVLGDDKWTIKENGDKFEITHIVNHRLRRHAQNSLAELRQKLGQYAGEEANLKRILERHQHECRVAEEQAAADHKTIPGGTKAEMQRIEDKLKADLADVSGKLKTCRKAQDRAIEDTRKATSRTYVAHKPNWRKKDMPEVELRCRPTT